MADPEAIDALEQIEREVIELEAEADESWTSRAAYAVYSGLVDEYAAFIDDDKEAQHLAKDIVTAVEDNVDTGFEGWQHNSTVLDAIEIQIIDVLVKHYDKADLVKTEAFVTDARDYVVTNFEARQNE